MKIEKDLEKRNPLMERNELHITLSHEGDATPSRAALQLFLSKHKKVEPERIEIKNIFSSFGKSFSSVSVFIWDKNVVPDLSKESQKEQEVKKEEAQKEVKKDG
jgi:ribosomal protein S24E